MFDVDKSMREGEDGGRAGNIDSRTGQPIEEAEKNLSRHATADSSPPVDEEWRTTVHADNESREQGEE
jgi:hypothetical protein